MDFRHIRAFIAVADASSVTKAAERLHISQPPLTRQIQQLEQELGLTLFVRHRHGVVLTEGGRRLLEKARQWDRAAADFADAASQLKAAQSGRLRVGIGWGLWDLVNLARVEFAKGHPDATIEALDAYCHFDSDALLRNDAIDVAFARPPFDPEFHVSDVVAEERIQAILPADHPLAERASVSIADLASTTLLLWDRHHAPVTFDKIFALYKSAGITPHTTATPNAGPFNHAGILLVASGKGFYFGYGVPASSQHPTSGVAVVPVSDPDATVEVRIVTRKGERLQLVESFVECAARVLIPVPEPVRRRA
jgi:LysR family transcriptional regulator, benzoate and cis,cis-muconate-responsive activator of ben and cat genes